MCTNSVAIDDVCETFSDRSTASVFGPMPSVTRDTVRKVPGRGSFHRYVKLNPSKVGFKGTTAHFWLVQYFDASEKQVKE